jgi:hypothetical protein
MRVGRGGGVFGGGGGIIGGAGPRLSLRVPAHSSGDLLPRFKVGYRITFP